MGTVDRCQVSRLLLDRLWAFRGEDVRIVALPGGGVPLAYGIAVSLGISLDATLEAHESLSGITVLVVADSIVDAEAVAAVARTAYARGAVRVVAIAPTVSPRAAARLGELVDNVVCLEDSKPPRPEPDRPHRRCAFATDGDIRRLLDAAAQRDPHARPPLRPRWQCPMTTVAAQPR
ncbi:hypothetical protein [Nocardia terpenica]|nr:hypothetical protein [Nocardia terpenica]NQE87318.1 hypothetical protein [Nocardia terpenica]